MDRSKLPHPLRLYQATLVLSEIMIAVGSLVPAYGISAILKHGDPQLPDDLGMLAAIWCIAFGLLSLFHRAVIRSTFALVYDAHPDTFRDWR